MNLYTHDSKGRIRKATRWERFRPFIMGYAVCWTIYSGIPKALAFARLWWV